MFQEDVETIIGEEFFNELENNLDDDSKIALNLYREKMKKKPEVQRPLNNWGFALIGEALLELKKKKTKQDKMDEQARKEALDLKKKHEKRQKAEKEKQV